MNWKSTVFLIFGVVSCMNSNDSSTDRSRASDSLSHVNDSVIHINDSINRIITSIINKNDSTGHITNLRVANNSVAGWVEDYSEYRMYDGQILMDQMIDGGAVPFIDHGLIEGIKQLFRFDTVYECELYTMDFGTLGNSHSMFEFMKPDPSDPPPLSVEGFDTTVVIGTKNLTGCFIIARFDRFFIQLQMSGYNADTASALRDAKAFLTVLKKKISP
jgi:hypothetical protein